MISRFDHAIVGVRDLEAAGARWRELGFDVVPGGRHPGRGTRNAIVRFGADYVELITVVDRGEALAAGGNGVVTAAFLDAHEGGLLGYALATDDIDGLAAHLRASGLDPVGPFPMRRERPDGRVLGWRLLFPFERTWLTPWPMFIQWDDPDEERLRWERPGVHANGANRVEAVRVAVTDPDVVRERFRRQLGLDEPERLGVELTAATGGPEGPVELVLATSDADRAGSFSLLGSQVTIVRR